MTVYEVLAFQQIQHTFFIEIDDEPGLEAECEVEKYVRNWGLKGYQDMRVVDGNITYPEHPAYWDVSVEGPAEGRPSVGIQRGRVKIHRCE